MLSPNPSNAPVEVDKVDSKAPGDVSTDVPVLQDSGLDEGMLYGDYFGAQLRSLVAKLEGLNSNAGAVIAEFKKR